MNEHATDAPTDGDWTTIICPKERLFELNIREIIRYRDLLLLLVRRDFVSVYKQTVLGPLWFIIQPLITTFMYMFVFGNIARMSTDNIPQPLFYFSGTMLWSFFSTNLTKSADTFIANAGLFGKIYFPRFIIPISYIITNSFTLVIQATVFSAFYLYYTVSGHAVSVTTAILFVPVFLCQLAALSVGCGIIVSSLTTKYRDLKNLLNFGMQLWMYATPIVYPLSMVPDKWRWAFVLNPVSPIIESFRFAVVGRGHIDGWQMIVSFGATLVILFFGIILFNHNERTFIDII